MRITISAGLNNNKGSLREVSDAHALAHILNTLPPQEEAWFSGHLWENQLRSSKTWRACQVIAIDVDYHDAQGNHVLRPAHDTLEGVLRLGLIPGNVYYLTPRGFRVLWLLGEELTSPEDFRQSAESAGKCVEDGLRAAGLPVASPGHPGYTLDTTALVDLARLLFTPTAIVKGVPRDAVAVVVREAPYRAEKSAKVYEIVRASPGAFEEAAKKYCQEHPRVLDGPGRQCPVCKHQGCFGSIRGSESKWSCFSSDHFGAGKNNGGVWSGDILDLDAFEAGRTPKEHLQFGGYLQRSVELTSPPDPISFDPGYRVLKSSSYASLCFILRDPGMRETVLGKGELEYNEQSMLPCLARVPLPEEGVDRLRERAEALLGKTEEKGLKFSVQDVQRALMHIAKEKIYHPVRDYLESLKWDGEERIHKVAEEILCARSPEVSSLILRKWFISAVARGLKPGCKVDTVFILIGPQGAQKSTFFSELGGKFFSDTKMTVGEKDAYIQLQRSWILEWAELETLHRANSASVKAFVTSCSDYFRPPYHRAVGEFPRPSIFVGTTNERDFLADPTGHRRYWPIEIGGYINVVQLRGWRDQLWAEAVAAYKTGEPWHMSAEENLLLTQVQQQFTEGDVWEESISEYLKSHSEVSITDVLTAVGKVVADCTKHDERRANNIMRSLGWERRNDKKWAKKA